MIIKKQNRQLEVDGEVAKIFDYDLPASSIGLSYQELDGRVPKKGSGTNSVCKEWYYIISGTGEVTIDGKTETIDAGDVIIIKPGQSSYLDARELKMLTITEPNWYQDQHTETDQS